MKAKFRQSSWTVKALPAGWQDLDLPPRRFALGHAFPLGCVSMLHALASGGKSMLLLTAFASKAIGRTLIPAWPAAGSGRSLYVAFEDDELEIKRRLQRIAFTHRLSANECNLIREWLRYLTPEDGVDVFRRGSGNLIVEGEHFDAIRQEIASEGPFDVLALDPKSSLLGGALDENDN